jgi:C4-type Zn-finger protein|uniref:Uncharacterized protein n=1 Tax=Ignisphaera aggregans TaxID=334771 RepID=A0A7J2U130_9CREN
MYQLKKPVNTCPKCGSSLLLAIETNKYKSREVIIAYTYMCPICRYKNVVEQVTVKANGDKIFITKFKSNAEKS